MAARVFCGCCVAFFGDAWGGGGTNSGDGLRILMTGGGVNRLDSLVPARYIVSIPRSRAMRDLFMWQYAYIFKITRHAIS
jgi:hypothetical protein